MEDKLFGSKVPRIDLTPLNLWGKQIIKHVGQKQWDVICAHVVERAGGACELCGASPKVPGVMGRRSTKFDIELRFEHDEARKLATLKRLVHVCVPCYQAIHLRQTQLMSEKMPAERSPMIGAIARLKHFHGVDEPEIEQWLMSELRMWKRREDNDYPENINVDIVESGLTHLWR